MKASGYSGTPLSKKLGIKPGSSVCIIDTPTNYLSLVPELRTTRVSKQLKAGCDLVHYFTSSRLALLKDVIKLKEAIAKNGCIWISWPKKSSGIKSDLNENIIRDIALTYGLVDVKVCAIDETWSGLKLVVPLRDR